MSLSLLERIERIQMDFTKRAAQAYSRELELGMTEMVQTVRQSTNAAIAAKPEETPDAT